VLLAIWDRKDHYLYSAVLYREINAIIQYRTVTINDEAEALPEGAGD
jgi:hypothetical protein